METQTSDPHGRSSGLTNNTVEAKMGPVSESKVVNLDPHLTHQA